MDSAGRSNWKWAHAARRVPGVRARPCRSARSREGIADEAIAEAQKSPELNPSFPWGLYVLGGAYAANGMFEEAAATHQRLFEMMPTLGRWGLGSTHKWGVRRTRGTWCSPTGVTRDGLAPDAS